MSIFNAIGSGIGAIGGLVQGALDRRQSKQNLDRTIAENRYMAEYEHSKNLEMWQRQNEYNAPLAQMDRLRSAGINPAMAFSKGQISNQSAVLPRYQRPQEQYDLQPFNVLGILGQFQDVGIKNSQQNLLNEQTRQASATADLKEKEARTANRYYYNRSWLMHDRRAREQWKNILETEYGQDLARYQKDKADLQNQILRKDIEYYLWNNIGSKAGSLIRALTPGKIGRGGMPRKLLPKGLRY